MYYTGGSGPVAGAIILIPTVGGPVGMLAGYVLALSMGVGDQTMNHIIGAGYLAGALCMAVAVARWAVLRQKKQ